MLTKDTEHSHSQSHNYYSIIAHSQVLPYTAALAGWFTGSTKSTPLHPILAILNQKELYSNNNDNEFQLLQSIKFAYPAGSSGWLAY